MDLDFTEDEISRYSRHILLREVGGTGQARLKAARVLIVGAGGLGSPLALYLAAAGVGTIGIVDDDRVELSNLQRQIAHNSASVGAYKASSAAQAATSINPGVRATAHTARLRADNALALIGKYDIVCDGTDNFASRFLVADACVLARRTLVSAAVLRFDGQLSVFKPHAHPGGPCYRCLYPEPPPAGLVPSCSEAGVLGAVTGVMGTLQATETLKEILGIGESSVWAAADLGCARRTLPYRAVAPGPGMPALRPDAADHRPVRASLMGTPLGVLLISGGYERAHYAFVLAAAAAALGRSVVLFATNDGTRALCADLAGVSNAEREARIHEAGVASLADLRTATMEMGARLIACEAGLRIAGADVTELLPGVEVAGVATFLAAIGGGQVITL